MTDSNPNDRQKYERITRRLEEHRDQALSSLPPGTDWLGIFLVGSQNYGLDTPQSDIDSRLLVLPSLRTFARGKNQMSKTILMDNDEYCDVKDVRTAFRLLLKQSTNDLEILFTEYAVVNPMYEDVLDDVIRQRERLAHYHPSQALYAMYGTAKSRAKNLLRVETSTKKDSERPDYNPKDLCFVLRMLELASSYADGRSFAECLRYPQPEYLKKLKAGDVRIADPARLASECCEVIGALANTAARIRTLTDTINREAAEENCDGGTDESIPELLDDAVYRLLCRHFGVVQTEP